VGIKQQRKEQKEMTSETENNLIDALDEVQDVHDERIAALEARVDAIEKMQAAWLANTAAAVAGARTRPASAQASATGAVGDEQLAQINARANMRQHMPVEPIRYGAPKR
jgi:hypothetical protein